MTESTLAPRHRWALDFALVGFVSPFFAIQGVDFGAGLFGVSFLITSSLVGAGSGALLGLGLRRTLGGRLGRTPIGALLLLGVLTGFLWGASVGVAGAGAQPIGLATRADVLFLAGMVAGIAGAFQFGWFWLPYTILTARGRSSLPLVLLAAALAWGLGWLGIFTLALIS